MMNGPHMCKCYAKLYLPFDAESVINDLSMLINKYTLSGEVLGLNFVFGLTIF